MKKTKPKGEIHLRIPPKLHEAIVALAEKNRRTVTAQITVMLEGATASE